jgi:large conductance mechanosensitive channel
VLKGFKEFVTRGNVVDLAVGVVIGAAFGTVVTSFTAAFLEPLIRLITGGEEAGGKFFVNGVAFDYGLFINAIIAFLLTALAVYFFVVVPMNRFRRQDEETAEELRLLTQIRDRLPQR